MKAGTRRLRQRHPAVRIKAEMQRANQASLPLGRAQRRYSIIALADGRTHAFSRAYSMNSSAWNRIDCGKLRPSAWAFFEVDHQFKGYRLSTDGALWRWLGIHRLGQGRRPVDELVLCSRPFEGRRDRPRSSRWERVSRSSASRPPQSEIGATFLAG